MRLHFLALGAVLASAQSTNLRPIVAHTEGAVYVDGQRVGAQGWQCPLAETSVVRTEPGRAGIRLAPGVMLRLGENSSFRTLAHSIEVLTGSAVVLRDDTAEKLTVLCEDAVTLSNSGVYRFDARTTPLNYCRFRVYKGAAAVRLSTMSVAVTSGQEMNLQRQCEDHIPVGRFDLADTDALDRWSPGH